MGLSNYDGPTLEKAEKILGEMKIPFIICQNKYSMFFRTIEDNGLLDMAEKLQKGLICYSPLAQGLLTGRYLNGIPKDSRIGSDNRFLKESALSEERMRQIQGLNALARERGQSLAQMALAWILQNKTVTSVLIGASKKEQIKENMEAVKNPAFTGEELGRIENILQLNS